MAEIFFSPAQLWPGGIPTAVGLHPDPELDEDDLPEEIRDVIDIRQEFSVPLSDPEEDKAQRRALIEKWASASQRFRDSYNSSGTSPNLTEFNGPWACKRFVCLVGKPYDPENYTRITKLLIFLYIHLQNTQCHPLSYEGHVPNPQLPAFILDPASITSSSTENYERLMASENLPVSYFLETADLTSMAMTRIGTVVFPCLGSYEYVVIDNQSLQDGLLCLLNFAPNGQVAHQTRIRPFRLGALMSIRHGRGHSWDELISERPEAAQCFNAPMNLHPPLLTIISRLGEEGDLGSLGDYSPTEWAEEFERFAPEYLFYELEGRAKDYSWSRLVDVSRDPFVTYNHLRYARQLAELQTQH